MLTYENKYVNTNIYYITYMYPTSATHIIERETERERSSTREGVRGKAVINGVDSRNPSYIQ